MTDIKNGTHIAVGSLQKTADAFALEVHVTDSEDLVHDHDLTVQMESNGKTELDEHAAGVALDRSIDEFFQLGKADDIVDLGIDLRL